MTFLGYERSNGAVGTRNYVLVIPGGIVASEICHFVAGTRTIVTSDSGSGRTKNDRETIARTMVGLASNPNVASVILHSANPGAEYPELKTELLAKQIVESGKRIELLKIDNGRVSNMIRRGIDLAREMVYEASKLRRKPFEDSHLCIGVKCGASDPTSGIAGNPVIGYLFDKLVKAGGTAFFGETTEIIGAEQILARRAVNKRIAKEIIEAANRIDRLAKASGQDVRTINPVPANIASGISTLEEKSLGAIHKAGSSPIQGVLKYAECPKKHGLYFVDNWMSASSIFMGYAAAGAQLVIFQLGGGGMKTDSSLYSPAGVVSPLLWTSANQNTLRLAEWRLDFYSGTVIEGKETIEETGERLYSTILDIASGTMTKTETLNYVDSNQVYTREPVF